MTSYGFVSGRRAGADYRGAHGMVATSYAPHHNRGTSLRSPTWSGHSGLHDVLALLRPQTTSTHLASLRLLVLNDEG